MVNEEDDDLSLDIGDDSEDEGEEDDADDGSEDGDDGTGTAVKIGVSRNLLCAGFVDIPEESSPAQVAMTSSVPRDVEKDYEEPEEDYVDYCGVEPISLDGQTECKCPACNKTFPTRDQVLRHLNTSSCHPLTSPQTTTPVKIKKPRNPRTAKADLWKGRLFIPDHKKPEDKSFPAAHLDTMKGECARQECNVPLSMKTKWYSAGKASTGGDPAPAPDGSTGNHVVWQKDHCVFSSDAKCPFVMRTCTNTLTDKAWIELGELKHADHDNIVKKRKTLVRPGFSIAQKHVLFASTYSIKMTGEALVRSAQLEGLSLSTAERKSAKRMLSKMKKTRSGVDNEVLGHWAAITQMCDKFLPKNLLFKNIHTPYCVKYVSEPMDDFFVALFTTENTRFLGTASVLVHGYDVSPVPQWISDLPNSHDKHCPRRKVCWIPHTVERKLRSFCFCPKGIERRARTCDPNLHFRGKMCKY
jgi:uncharacterized C2H2 Zn-finger protein